jgi:transmembrane sensor
MINEEALGWVIRTRDPEFQDWDAFTLWLEAHPAHAPAYDALMAADSDLDSIVPEDPVIMPVAANDRGPRRPLRWIGGGAVAAALVGVISVGLLNRSDIYSVTTRPGETRTIALDDGTRVELNGGTTMRFDSTSSIPGTRPISACRKARSSIIRMRRRLPCPPVALCPTMRRACA